MRKAMVLLGILLMAVACQDIERPEKPDNLIKKERFKEILYDVSLINAARDFSRGRLKSAGIQPDTFIYKKYAIDSLQFAKSLEYYAVDFTEYQKIWEDVSKRIGQKHTEVDSLVKIQDSIETAKNKEKPKKESTGLMNPDEFEENLKN